MKQDRAESQAVADAAEKLPYGLRRLPVVDAQQVEYLAPDLLLPGTKKAAPQTELVGPPLPGVPMRLPMQLRSLWREQHDFFTQKATRGMYAAADHAEWASIPVSWRVILMMAGGMGDMETIDYLAGRSWQEIPPKEREAVKYMVREGKRLFGGLRALALRTVE